MTNGVFLNYFKKDSYLSDFSVLMIEEDQDDLDYEVIMGVIKNILINRKSLKIVIFGPSLDTQKYKCYLKSPAILEFNSREQDYQSYYLNRTSANYITMAL